MASTSKQSWFTPVLVLAPVLLLIGWNIGGWISSPSRTFQGNGFTFNYSGHWTRSDIDKGDHPGETNPDSARFAALAQADSSVTRLVQFADPHVAVVVRDAALPGFSIALDQKAYNSHHYQQYEQLGFEEVPGQAEGVKAYRLQFGFVKALGGGENLRCKGEDNIVIKGTRMVVLTYLAPVEGYATELDSYEDMVASIAFSN